MKAEGGEERKLKRSVKKKRDKRKNNSGLIKRRNGFAKNKDRSA